MNLVYFAVWITLCNAAKLDRTYLPPESASTAGGSDLQTPFSRSSDNQGFPSGGYVNEFQGVVVDAVNTGIRATDIAQSNLGASRITYGSTDSKVGDAAFRDTTNLQPNNQNQASTLPNIAGFRQPIQPGPNRGDIEEKPETERIQATRDRVSNIVKYQNDIGTKDFNYAFETDNGIAAEGNGVATNGVRTQGGYSYTGDDGRVYSVMYVADENGYRPVGDHLPTPPPIPKEIAEALQQIAKDDAAGIVDDGSYDAQKYNTDYTKDQYNNGQANKLRPAVNAISNPIQDKLTFNKPQLTQNQDNGFVSNQFDSDSKFSSENKITSSNVVSQSQNGFESNNNFGSNQGFQANQVFNNLNSQAMTLQQGFNNLSQAVSVEENKEETTSLPLSQQKLEDKKEGLTVGRPTSYDAPIIGTVQYANQQTPSNNFATNIVSTQQVGTSQFQKPFFVQSNQITNAQSGQNQNFAVGSSQMGVNSLQSHIYNSQTPIFSIKQTTGSSRPLISQMQPFSSSINTGAFANTVQLFPSTFPNNQNNQQSFSTTIRPAFESVFNTKQQNNNNVYNQPSKPFTTSISHSQFFPSLSNPVNVVSVTQNAIPSGFTVFPKPPTSVPSLILLTPKEDNQNVNQGLINGLTQASFSPFPSISPTSSNQQPSSTFGALQFQNNQFSSSSEASVQSINQNYNSIEVQSQNQHSGPNNVPGPQNAQTQQNQGEVYEYQIPTQTLPISSEKPVQTFILQEQFQTAQENKNEEQYNQQTISNIPTNFNSQQNQISQTQSNLEQNRQTSESSNQSGVFFRPKLLPSRPQFSSSCCSGSAQKIEKDSGETNRNQINNQEQTTVSSNQSGVFFRPKLLPSRPQFSSGCCSGSAQKIEKNSEEINRNQINNQEQNFSNQFNSASTQSFNQGQISNGEKFTGRPQTFDESGYHY